MDTMKKLKLLLANIILAGVLVLGGCADAGESSQSSYLLKKQPRRNPVHLKIKIRMPKTVRMIHLHRRIPVILPVLIPQARQRLPLLRQKLRL